MENMALENEFLIREKGKKKLTEEELEDLKEVVILILMLSRRVGKCTSFSNFQIVH